MSHLSEFVMAVQANEVVVLSSCNNYNGQNKSDKSWLSRVELDWFYKLENIKTHMYSHVSVAKKDMYTSVLQ